MDLEKKPRRLTLERFTVKEVWRSHIKLAAYNPRIITAEAKKRLHKGLRKHGAVVPLVWNERTGNLVSGHQRLSDYDQRMKYKAGDAESDYILHVAAIDVDERGEKQLNVQLNNESLMGEWDLDALKSMNRDMDISFEDMGFSEPDIDILFAGDPDISAAFADPPSVVKTKDEIRDIRDKRKETMAAAKALREKANDGEFYFVVVCEDAKAREILLRRLGCSIYEEYIAGGIVTRNLTAEAMARASEPQTTPACPGPETE